MKLLGFDVWSSSLPENIFSYRIYNTINPHSYQTCKNDPLFHKALLASDVLLPDGIGIVWAAAFLQRKRIHKIAGTDLHHHVLRKLQEHNGSCFYLGSSPGTLDLSTITLGVQVI